MDGGQQQRLEDRVPNSRNDDFGAVDDDGEPSDWDLSFRIAPTRDPYSPPGDDADYAGWTADRDAEQRLSDDDSTRAFDAYHDQRDSDSSAWYEQDEGQAADSAVYGDPEGAGFYEGDYPDDGDERSQRAGRSGWRSDEFPAPEDGSGRSLHDTHPRRTTDTWGRSSGYAEDDYPDRSHTDRGLEDPEYGDRGYGDRASGAHADAGYADESYAGRDDAEDRYPVGDAEAARSHGRARTPQGRDASARSMPGHSDRSGWSEAAREQQRPTTDPTKKPAKKRPAGSGRQRQGSGGRDLGMAALVGAALLVLGLLAMELGAAATTALIMVVVGLGSAEFFAVLRERGYRPATLLGIAGSVGVVLAAYHHGPRAIAMLTVLMTFFSFAWYLFKVEEAPPLTNVAFTMLGFLMVGVFGSYGAMLVVLPDGIGRLAGTVACIVAADVGGYFVGRAIGRVKLAPDVSPGKTLEGFLGGVAASVLVSVLLLGMIAPWDADVMDRLLLGLVLGCIGPLGDLSASMVKRELGVKDFGSLLPEHGGILDRFDAMLFALPVTYYLSVAFILN